VPRRLSATASFHSNLSARLSGSAAEASIHGKKTPDFRLQTNSLNTPLPKASFGWNFEIA
jgi:hypothetical protein